MVSRDSTQWLAIIRERLQERMDNGTLHVVTTKARVDMQVVADWLHDYQKMPSESELNDLHIAVAHEHYTNEAQLALLDERDGGFDPYDSRLPFLLRRQAE